MIHQIYNFLKSCLWAVPISDVYDIYCICQKLYLTHPCHLATLRLYGRDRQRLEWWLQVRSLECNWETGCIHVPLSMSQPIAEQRYIHEKRFNHYYNTWSSRIRNPVKNTVRREKRITGVVTKYLAITLTKSLFSSLYTNLNTFLFQAG